MEKAIPVLFTLVGNQELKLKDSKFENVELMETPEGKAFEILYGTY
jgi:hypothetical protein